MTFLSNLSSEFLSQFLPESVLDSNESYLHCSLLGSQLYGVANSSSPSDFLLVCRQSRSDFIEGETTCVRIIGLDQFCSLLQTGDKVVTESLFHNYFSFSVDAFRALRVNYSAFVSLPYLQGLRSFIRLHLERCYLATFNLKSAYSSFSTAWIMRYLIHKGVFPHFSGKEWHWARQLRSGKVLHDDFKSVMLQLLTDLEELKYLIEAYPAPPKSLILDWKSFMESTLK